MTFKLKDIAEIIPGYSFRGAIQSDPEGNTYLLQARNVKMNDSVRSIQYLEKVKFPSLRSAAFVKKNDVLILSRGSGAGTFRAGIYALDENNVIASASLHIIRVINPNMIPEYLALCLNSLDGQKAIEQIATGTNLQTLTSTQVGELEIPIPSLKEQQAIINLYKAQKAQEEINLRKNEIYANLMNATIRHFFTSIYK